MALDELACLFGFLRQQIADHGNRFRQNEIRTRYGLIDPVLEALGWDVSDSARVVPEYDIDGGGRADYALVASSGKPLVLVEAKRLDTPLAEGLDQSIRYALRCGANYVVVTDGARWQIYDRRKEGKLADLKIVDFNLHDPMPTLISSSIWLWRGNFDDGKSGISARLPDVASLSQRIPPEREASRGDWVSLGGFRPQPRMRPPEALRFPDSAQRTVALWLDLQVLVVEWLVQTGMLRRQDCPVVTDRGTHLVHIEPVRKNGSSFISPKQVGEFWVEAAYDARDLVRQAANILQARGVDPTTVSLLININN